MSLVAIFTAPKPFTNPHIATIQRNAISTWKALGPEAEVWLVGDEEGVSQTADELGTGYIADVERNAAGTPRIDSIFDLVRKNSAAPVLAYVNADILLLPDFIQAVKDISAVARRYLVIGQRWDLDIRESMVFTDGWVENLKQEVKTRAKLHVATGSDYFIFPRNEFLKIPQFAVGRAGWDNWMIYAGRRDHLAVVDATKSITAVHQDHDYSHLPGGKIHRFQPESLENISLMGGRHVVYSLLDANYYLENSSLRRTRMTRWKLVREISIFPAVVLKCDYLAKIFYFIFNPKRALRDIRKDRALKLEHK